MKQSIGIFLKTGLLGIGFAFAIGCDSGASDNAGDTMSVEVLDDQAQFLSDNAARAGVTVTASGLHYEVLRSGNGIMPVATDIVTVHYQGALVDGTEFDSSYARGEPSTFALNGVIDGWIEGLQLMSIGGQYRIVLPPELAYGDRGAGTDIPPNAVLIFEIELLEVNTG